MGKRLGFVALLALLAVSGLVTYRRPSSVQTVYPVRFADRVLILDAGHGGEDGGAVSLTGAKESQINLSVALRADLIFGLYGVRTLPLRRTDISLHSEGAETLRQKKNSDLHNRADRVNAQENAILLSIHQNSYPDGRYHGAQVFYAPTQGSQALAQTMQETLRLTLDPNNTRQEKPIQDTIYLMNHITCPGILVECGFLSNRAEEQRLRDSTYQTKLAVALVGGYLNAIT